MNDFFRTAIYSKNVPPAERLVRLVAAVVAAALGFQFLPEAWMQWSAVGGAAMFAMTGVLGFCPACYFAGRRLVNKTT